MTATRRRLIGLALSGAVMLAAAACVRLPEDGPPSARLSSRGVEFAKPVRTWKDLRERNVVMQRFDYSCGAAALATLMHHYFGDDVSEKDVLDGILAGLSAAELEDRTRKGFSLLDLKTFAERRGYQAVGARLKFQALTRLAGPVLVYLETDDYKHFAVLRGVKEDRVYLADPARGNLRLPVHRFAGEWTGIALVLGKAGFGTPREHPLAIEQPIPIRNELRAARRALYS